MEKMSRSTLILLSVLGVCIGLSFWFLSLRNGFVTSQEAISSSWAQVENQLQRRSDLIPNLVNAVKGYARHEQAVFDNIAKARAQMAGARTQSDKVAAAGQFESALSRLMVVVEQYPNLKADQQFRQLMDELSGSENRISVERKRYNENVQVYNVQIKRFPGVLVASLLHYEKKTYFEISEKAKEVPKVEF